MADGIINRARDNWQVLKAIATVAGGEWPGYIDAAAQAAQARTGEETSQLERLLADIKAVAFGGDDDEVPSAVLVQRLIELEGRPWAEMGKNDKPLTQNKLARLLKDVGIAPEQVGPEDHRVRGYKREQFDEAFERYLAVSQPSIRPERDEIRTSDISEPSSPMTAGRMKNARNPITTGFWTDGRLEKGVLPKSTTFATIAAVRAATKFTSATGRRRGCTANARRCIASMRATLQME